LTKGLFVAAGLLFAGSVAATALALRPSKQGLADDPRQQARIQVMREHLATQKTPFMILAGDSHAELLNWDRLCGLPVVNLGLSGVTAIHYGKILAMLRPDRKADRAVVFLGTNDLARRLKPETASSLARFEKRFAGVLSDLQSFATRTAYAPVMPAGDDPRASTWLATELVGQYRNAAKAACLMGGCAPIDLDGVDLGFREDGVHVDRADRTTNGALHRATEIELCPDRMRDSARSGP
jgi:hypothetical protein